VPTTALSFDPHLYKILNQAACSMKNSLGKESHENLSLNGPNIKITDFAKEHVFE
jgi:hypothetical protein